VGGHVLVPAGRQRDLPAHQRRRPAAEGAGTEPLLDPHADSQRRLGDARRCHLSPERVMDGISAAT